jgi:hypothetical protein
MIGPTGAKVSKDFALVKLFSSFCMSLAVTSLKQVNPNIASRAFFSAIFLQRLPITTASSPS